MPVTRAFPDAVTTVDATEMYDLGTEWSMSASEVAGLGLTSVTGPCIWRYVKCTAAAAVGEIIGRGTATPYVGANTAAVTADGALGAAQFAIAANQYAWVLRKGVGRLARMTLALTSRMPRWRSRALSVGPTPRLPQARSWASV